MVYSDHQVMEAMERLYPVCEGFPSYHPSGLTPPMGRVVKERFARREHGGVPPPREEIMEVEKELMELVKRVNKGGGKKTGGGGTKGGGSSSASKALTEYEDEVVQYEPWMDNDGTGKGVEFLEDDDLCLQHPELWLDPKEMGRDEKSAEDEKAAMDGGMEVTKSKKSLNGSPTKKKEKKKKKKKDPSSSPKVAVNRPPARDEDKDVENMARQIAQNKDDIDDLFFPDDEADGDLFGLGFEAGGDLDFL